MRWVMGVDALPRLASESDCLVIAAPHTAETKGTVTRAVLERLPQDAIVVNVSRGTLLDEAGFVDLLHASRPRGGGPRVFAVGALPPRPPLLGPSPGGGWPPPAAGEGP